jgi:signal transduction histidine kinase
MNKRELIFEKFKQADPSGETETQGTGLGLAIAKGIVTAHGGTIGVKSSEQWSSIFWIRLPLRHQTYPADRF